MTPSISQHTSAWPHKWTSEANIVLDSRVVQRQADRREYRRAANTTQLSEELMAPSVEPDHSPIASSVVHSSLFLPNPLYPEIARRLKELSILAHQDGISPSPESRTAMQIFLESERLKARPLIFLQDNGNYRIIWRNSEKEQVAIEFMDGNWAQFVIFKKASDGRMARVAGNVRLESLHSQITANGAESLLV